MQSFFNLLAVIGTFGTLMMGLAIYNDYQEVKAKQEKHKAKVRKSKATNSKAKKAGRRRV